MWLLLELILFTRADFVRWVIGFEFWEIKSPWCKEALIFRTCRGRWIYFISSYGLAVLGTISIIELTFEIELILIFIACQIYHQEYDEWKFSGSECGEIFWLRGTLISWSAIKMFILLVMVRFHICNRGPPPYPIF